MGSIPSSLDSQIQYLSHEFMANQVVFRMKTRFITAICPYCGIEANKMHSKYRRVFQDIPISIFKTMIHLELLNFFASTFIVPLLLLAYPFLFIEPKARKTKRLETKNLTLSLEMSSINSAKRLNQQNIKISKIEICRLI